MALAVPVAPASARPQLRIDCVKPVFWALAAVLAVLVVLPLAWLACYAVVDKDGQLTAANFVALVQNAALLSRYHA